ncbi:hypothetical protein S7711_07515 [Stachybotrys chartarum IBT 7711]|uniref:Domain of unknown function at the cortex 1 domain-containing protein n=1 Tax=Stachybotrys chartarum (strain CBS 109288 / IBT 7711) TaxID=1280523 RepID=A0A084AK54_STACB|nr:hypothetical protein S7711_07515 [Stachybotrys chartarum IBT 7711]KFA54166.1 hypothetical protein S40293_06287 [Stachybotrys chartarum IBT 40293]
MAENYILRVTAGPGYEESQHVEVPVNKSDPVHIKSDLAEVELNVRVQDYRGLPRNSPSTSPYFALEPHKYNQDQYSIGFRFTPRKPTSAGAGSEEGIKGTDLQFGNDFDHPIRDRLPPGFNTAMSIVKWWIDPGLDGDAYADRPHLYGPALSSFNAIHVGKGDHDEQKGGLWFDEGGDEEGLQTRADAGMPATSKERMRWALNEKNKEEWRFEYGKTYGLDFFNPYLDFTNLALRLPGFHLPIMRYWDGQGLRYVLRNKETDEVYLVVLFTLYRKEDVNEDGTLKQGAEARATDAEGGEMDGEGEQSANHDEEEALRQAREKLGEPHGQTQTNADDVD